MQPREVGERIDKLVRLQRAELLRAEEEELLSGEASGDPRAQTDIVQTVRDEVAPDAVAPAALKVAQHLITRTEPADERMSLRA